MLKNERWDTAPNNHIRALFEQTRDGKLTITYYPWPNDPVEQTYEMDWTVADAEQVVRKYEKLVAILDTLGELHDKLEDESSRKQLLTAEENEVWETFIRPIEPFEEVDQMTLCELYQRSETYDLSDEEYEILERHYHWQKEQSLKRLPFERCNPSDFMQRARRYEKLVSLNAPALVKQEEGRCLAEEMVLYYCSKRKDENNGN